MRRGLWLAALAALLVAGIFAASALARKPTQCHGRNCTTSSTTTTTSSSSSTTTTTVPTTTTTPPPVGEPAPIAGQGYQKVFGDEFDTLNRAVWDDHAWYLPAAPADAQYVENGVFHVVSRRSQGYPANESTTLTSGKAFTYGYFEARMRWTGGQGSWPAFWLMSKGWAQTGSCSTPASEIDVMEGQGSDPFGFYGTIHTDSASACSGHVQNANNYDLWPTRLADNWHVYAVLWTATQACWYVDDTFSHCAPTYADTDDSPMFLMLQMMTGGWSGGTNSTTPAELHSEFDWVRVWQK